ncbi:MAG: hypothetical protein AAFX85_05015, partial [Pseudomonadota bacterium]
EVQVEAGLVEAGQVELRLLDLKQIERVLTRVLLVPVVEVDGRQLSVGRGPVVERLQAAYQAWIGEHLSFGPQ